MTDDITFSGVTYVTGLTIRNASDSEVTTLSFSNAAGIAVTIHPDGRVEVNPKFSTDETAQAFWDAVKALAPQMFGKATAPSDVSGLVERAWHLGSMNDGLFIIDTPPRPSTDDVWPDRPDGPSVAMNIAELPYAKAKAIVDGHNATLTSLASDNAALRAEAERLNQAVKNMVPIHRDGSHVFLDGIGDVELDLGRALRTRAERAEAALAEKDKALEAADELEAAGHTVLCGLNARIDAAPSAAKPVFHGVADLHDALSHFRAARRARQAGGASHG